jgi:hypothetical protein
MPALVNSRFGESGMRLDDGTMVCRWDLKKSKNDWRISALVIVQWTGQMLGPVRIDMYSGTGGPEKAQKVSQPRRV